jgi:hypothetical protein
MEQRCKARTLSSLEITPLDACCPRFYEGTRSSSVPEVQIISANVLPQRYLSIGPERAPAEDVAQAPFAPVSLGTKIVSFGRLALREPQYRGHFATLLTGRLALGLSEAGYFMLLQSLGSPGVAASAAMLLETSRSAGAVLGHHQRDNEDILPASEDTSNRDRTRCVRQMCGWGVADSACTVGLLVCTAATLPAEAAPPLLAIVLGLQVSKTYFTTRQVGAWNCTKVHLGDAVARQQQRAMNRTIGSMEHVAFSLLSSTMGTSIYLGLNRGASIPLRAPSQTLLGAASLLGVAASGAFLYVSRGPVAPPSLPMDESEGRLLSFTGKARAFGNLLTQEPDYRSHAAAMLLAKIGLGMVNSGYLRLMNKAGRASDVAVITALEEFARFFSALWAHHQRDDEDNLSAAPHLRRARFEHRLASCGLADAAVSGILLFGLSGQVTSMAVIRSVLVAVKIAETYVRGREVGYWSCLKMYLGHTEARRDQRKINRTIAAFELLALSVVSHALSVASYAILRKRTDYLMAVGLGAMLACASRLYFCREAYRMVPADADEARPLLQASTPPLSS